MKTRWFFVLHHGSAKARPWQSYYTHLHLMLESWRRYASNDLVPHMLYDGDPDNLPAFVHSYGVRVIPFRTTFADIIMRARPTSELWDHDTALGAYLKIDAAMIASVLRQRIGWNKNIFITDVDVLFTERWNADEVLRPFAARLDSVNAPGVSYTTPFIRGGPPMWTGEERGVNSGVLVVDPVAYALRESELRGAAAVLTGTRPAYDQMIINATFRNRDKERFRVGFESRPFWDDAHHWTRAGLVHFHGPKWGQVLAMLMNGVPPNSPDILHRLFEDSRVSYLSLAEMIRTQYADVLAHQGSYRL